MIPGVDDVTGAIQLALAPVFLLTGIAGLLSVMAGRLARIIDRGRAFTEGRVPASSLEETSLDLERQSLERRRHLTSIAITACTIAALLVCMVIAVLFVEIMIQVRLKWLIGGLFTFAMLALVIGLTYFLREVHLAMQTVRLALHEGKKGSKPVP
ncbi:MAG TPA: DUF2721 domain-containing protein [Burkholderiales bacterium]|nr:DUF2721 domain-containing protein [Burkholderiales bacterium]